MSSPDHEYEVMLERIRELEDAIREHIEDYPDDLSGDEGLKKVLGPADG